MEEPQIKRAKLEVSRLLAPTPSVPALAEPFRCLCCPQTQGCFDAAVLDLPLLPQSGAPAGGGATPGGTGAPHPQQAAPAPAGSDSQRPGGTSQAQGQQPGGEGGDPQPQAAQQAGAPPVMPLPVVPDNTYMSREARHIERERSGELEARYIKNDGSIESGRLLIGLKNVFAKCLPNMPKEYICRLIFERRHK